MLTLNKLELNNGSGVLFTQHQQNIQLPDFVIDAIKMATTQKLFELKLTFYPLNCSSRSVLSYGM